MAISPVNSVSFKNNYNQANFEGKRKNNEQQHSSGMSNTLKSIPVAALIAMSPLNVVSVNAQSVNDAKPKTEQVQPEEKVVATASCKIGTPDGKPCTVYFIDSDGDDTTAERIVLRFDYFGKRSKQDKNGKREVYKYTESTYINVDTLEVINYTAKYKNKPDWNYKSYKVKGYGKVEYTIPRTDDGKPLRSTPAKTKYKSCIEQEIVEGLYGDLNKMFGENEVVRKTTNVTYDGDAEDDLDLLFPFGPLGL